MHAHPMTAHEAVQVAAWRYDDAWSVYDLDSQQPLLDELSCYHSVFADDQLIGFCCTGTAARVAGMTEEPGVLDVGMGMNPQLVGAGRGAEFGGFVLEYLDARYGNQTLRAVVQDWNERSLRLIRRLGFTDAGDLIVLPGGRPVTYRVMTRP